MYDPCAQDMGIIFDCFLDANN